MTENEYNNLLKIRDKFDSFKLKQAIQVPRWTTIGIIVLLSSSLLLFTSVHYYFVLFGYFASILFLHKIVLYFFIVAFMKIENFEKRIHEYLFQLELKENPTQYNAIMLRKNYIHLENYFRQSLIQNRNIFIFGIMLSFIGVGVIPLILFMNNKDVTIISLIQAVLIGFILKIFQLMYSKTNDSVQKFYSDLAKGYENNIGNLGDIDKIEKV